MELRAAGGALREQRELGKGQEDVELREAGVEGVPGVCSIFDQGLRVLCGQLDLSLQAQLGTLLPPLPPPAEADVALFGEGHTGAQARGELEQALEPAHRADGHRVLAGAAGDEVVQQALARRAAGRPDAEDFPGERPALAQGHERGGESREPAPLQGRQDCWWQGLHRGLGAHRLEPAQGPLHVREHAQAGFGDLGELGVLQQRLHGVLAAPNGGEVGQGAAHPAPEEALAPGRAAGVEAVEQRAFEPGLRLQDVEVRERRAVHAQGRPRPTPTAAPP